jgi:GntR family transcriptional regulator
VTDIPKYLFSVDHQSKRPLYDQIGRNLRELIVSDKFKIGEAVPSEWELAELYGVSRLTVRKALDELVRQQLLSKRRGVGTFVTKPSITSIAPSELSFTNQMLAIGKKPSSKFINSGVEVASPEITRSLLVSQGDQVFYLTRVRLADNVPILYETTYLSLERFPDLVRADGWTDGSLYKYLLEAYSVRVTSIEQTLKPVLLSKEQASHLYTKPGTPSIQSICIAHTSDGALVEYAISVSNGEVSEFYFTFKKKGL